MLIYRLIILIMHLLEQLIDLIFIQAVILVLVSLDSLSLNNRIINYWLLLLKSFLLLFLYLKFGNSGDKYMIILAFLFGYNFKLGPLLLR